MLGQPLDEFKPETRQPVPVGNHKSELISAVESLQYGEQSLSFPVEPTGDVSDNLARGIEFSQVGNLPPQVSALLGGADPAVADCFRVWVSPEVKVDILEALAF